MDVRATIRWEGTDSSSVMAILEGLMNGSVGTARDGTDNIAMSRAPEGSGAMKSTVPLVRTVGFDLEAERSLEPGAHTEERPVMLQTAASLSPVRIPHALFKKSQVQNESSRPLQERADSTEEKRKSEEKTRNESFAERLDASDREQPPTAEGDFDVHDEVDVSMRLHPSGSVIAHAISEPRKGRDSQDTGQRNVQMGEQDIQEMQSHVCEDKEDTVLPQECKDSEEANGMETLSNKTDENVNSSKETKGRLTRAERRELQERQRAAKAESKAAAEGGSTRSSTKKPNTQTAAATQRPQHSVGRGNFTGAMEGVDDKKKVKKILKKGLVPQIRPNKVVELFSHIRQVDEDMLKKSLMEVGLGSSVLHPDVVEIGLQYADGTLSGGSARCFTMLTAFRNMILSYITPSGKQFSRDLTAKLNTNIQFLTQCRPLSASMGNAIRWLKMQVANVDSTLLDESSRNLLVASIDQYIQEKILFAEKRIVELGLTKIADGDVLLTYAFSYVVLKLLLTAHDEGKCFKVIIVDSRPHNEAQELLSRLLKAGIQCVYTHINATPYVMEEATKVFLGASAVLANGTVISRAGTAAIACAANGFGLPVMVCCESNKFHERVQLDSITSNELGDPSALARLREKPDLQHLQDWEDVDNLFLLNLKYDAMQAECVTMIITEFGLVPPTSVPVILREYRTDPF